MPEIPWQMYACKTNSVGMKMSHIFIFTYDVDVISEFIQHNVHASSR